jgi:hypothetical protein
MCPRDSWRIVKQGSWLVSLKLSFSDTFCISSRMAPWRPRPCKASSGAKSDCEAILGQLCGVSLTGSRAVMAGWGGGRGESDLL